MALPPHFVTTEIEFAWLVTVQYRSPEGVAIATRIGTVTADPSRDTRASLLEQAIGTVKNEMGVQDAVVLYAYLERNAL